MTEVKRKKGESFESLLRRFNSRVQMSGRLLQAKKVRFTVKTPNQNKKKATALQRIKTRDKLQYMLRSGKIREEDLNRRTMKLKVKGK